MPAVRSVVLVRYRPGMTGQTARIVHLVPLPTGGQAGVVSALCDALLSFHIIEAVTSGQGMPCRLCVINHITSTTAPGESPTANPDGADTAGLAAGGVEFQEWGWPVTCCCPPLVLRTKPSFKMHMSRRASSSR